MNMAQAKAVVRLLQDAAHPRTDPTTAQFYTPDELTELGQPSIHLNGYDGPDEHGPEMLVISLYGTRADDRQLYMSATGALHVWSSVRIPPEDCPCECERDVFGVMTAPIPQSVERCPVHGQGVREIDCFRAVMSVGWEIKVPTADRPMSCASWNLVVREGEPIRDVLAEYRAERARAKRLEAVDEAPFNEPADTSYRGCA